SLVVGSIIKIPNQTIKLEILLTNIKNISPLLKEAKEHLGKSYVWGAVGPAKFDCSGFTSFVCRKNGIYIPRTSIMQGEVGIKVARKELQEGDLIFFDTSKEKKGYITHVGIYLGDNKFIHASSANKEVVISSLNQSFYKARFKWGRRVNKLIASK
ncbi:MAG: C40 family peptidase, partial [Sulfurovum sp.]|nr:C40 family peptidase [Sulfurovaceae bacterium]